ncbi:hypothetical protein K474DRAFT_1658262 [Panus rudis PR-1116 ss-1]|nr:hypothetical protein K474DRAFT_1658262 [Panus rudis PR-1116 ss-1]
MEPYRWQTPALTIYSAPLLIDVIVSILVMKLLIQNYLLIVKKIGPIYGISVTGVLFIITVSYLLVSMASLVLSLMEATNRPGMDIFRTALEVSFMFMLRTFNLDNCSNLSVLQRCSL